jgi:hypothetical protein
LRFCEHPSSELKRSGQPVLLFMIRGLIKTSPRSRRNMLCLAGSL